MLQPQNVRLRHITMVSTGDGIPAGINVANSVFQEQDPNGVNGPQGWSSGSYTSQLQLEGSFTLNFPNTYGADGVLHRNRFLILTSPDYEVGEEWFEIWQEDVLLFVGTPTGAQLDQNNIQLTGVDGLWLMNKVRETAAGVWHHAPRDVIERYSQVWVGLYASDMQKTAWTWATGTVAESPLQYSRAEFYGEGVRLRPSAPTATAEIAYFDTNLSAGTGPQILNGSTHKYNLPHRDWSVEWVFTRSSLATLATPPTSDEGTTVSYIRVGFYENAIGSNELFTVTMMEDTIFMRSGDAGWKINTKVDTAPPGPHRIKFEQRDYWLFVYVNGKLLGCMPMMNETATLPLHYESTNVFPFFRLFSATSIGGDEWAVVQQVVIRQAFPMLLRQGSAARQRVSITGSPSGGTYTLSYKNATTAGIAAATNPSSALNGLSTVLNDGGLTVTGSSPTWTLNWNGIGYRPLPVAISSLTGGTNPAVVVSYPLTTKNTIETGGGVTDVGEKRLPGLYPSGGLVGQYYDDSDIQSLLTDGSGVAVQALQLSPARTPYFTRNESSVYFAQAGSTVGGGWQPDGPPTNDSFCARWTGSIYLDLNNSDYRLRFGAGRYRLWVGGTRFQDRLLDTWDDVGQTTYNTTGWLKGTTGSPGVLYGEVSGWYPIVIEWSEAGEPPQLTYQYGPDGGPATYSNFYPIPGSTLYGTLQLTRTAIEAFWPMNEGRYGSPANNMIDQSNAGIDLTTATNLTTGHTAWKNGPFLGSIALDLNTDVPATPSMWSTTFVQALNPTNGKFSISCWIRLDATGANQTIMQSARSSVGYAFSVSNTNHIQINVNNGNTMVGSTTLVANVWYHVAVTYDGTTAKLYVNGAVDNSSALTYTPNTLGDTRVGAGGLFGATPWTAGSGFQGRISNLAFYSTMVSAANILNDYNQQFTIDTVALSPLGVYDADIRMDSHYNQIQTVLSTFGHQLTCAPRSLESGEFPGVIAPKTRVGRDTEFVLTADEATAYSKTVDATDVVDALLGDAQGLGDPSGDAQITYETYQIDSIYPQKHLFLHQDYDQASQANRLEVFQAYLDTLRELRESPWEQVSAQPPGFTEYIDQFPLSGSMAAFRWVPGDGVRIVIPEIQVIDTTPRQIMGVQWGLTPEGATSPVATFRQRPRDLYRSLRAMQQAIWNVKRAYQLQVFTVTGSLAGFGTQQLQTAGGAALGGVGTNVSRVGLPHHLNDIMRAEVVLESKADTATIQLWINSSANGGQDTGIKVKQRGRYDVTGFIGRANGTDQYMSCFFRDNTGSSISNTSSTAGVFHIELLVKA